MPILQELLFDTSTYVRSALALHVTEMARRLGEEDTLTLLLPLLNQLLKDEHWDVRLNVIAKLNTIHDVIGIDRLSESLLPAVFRLAGDKQWRVRLSIIEHTPLLAKQLVSNLIHPDGGRKQERMRPSPCLVRPIQTDGDANGDGLGYQLF